MAATAAPPPPSGYEGSPLASTVAVGVGGVAVGSTGSSVPPVQPTASTGSKVTKDEFTCSFFFLFTFFLVNVVSVYFISDVCDTRHQATRKQPSRNVAIRNLASDHVTDNSRKSPPIQHLPAGVPAREGDPDIEVINQIEKD